MMPWPRVLIFWLADIRKAALIACVAAVLGCLIPEWNAVQSMFAIESIRQWSVPLIVLGFCVDVIPPAFCFALCRNEGLPDFSKNLRLLSLTAAIVLGIITVAGLPQWIESLGSYWADISVFDWSAGAATVSMAAQEPGTRTQVASLLVEFSNLAYIMLLIAFFKRASKQSHAAITVSRPLAIATRVAVIAWGLVVAVCLVRLLYMPFIYIQLRDHAIEVGRMPPRLGAMMAEAVRTLLLQACFLAAPYVVYRSALSRSETAEHAISTP